MWKEKKISRFEIFLKWLLHSRKSLNFDAKTFE